eukprot:scaffold263856_cov19-Tisochrysis_lutea.AAC.1
MHMLARKLLLLLAKQCLGSEGDKSADERPESTDCGTRSSSFTCLVTLRGKCCCNVTVGGSP